MRIFGLIDRSGHPTRIIAGVLLTLLSRTVVDIARKSVPRRGGRFRADPSGRNDKVPAHSKSLAAQFVNEIYLSATRG